MTTLWQDEPTSVPPRIARWDWLATPVDLTQPPLAIPRPSWALVLASLGRRVARVVTRPLMRRRLEARLRTLKTERRTLRLRRDLGYEAGRVAWVIDRVRLAALGEQIEKAEEELATW